jgi:hypothetical protein
VNLLEFRKSELLLVSEASLLLEDTEQADLCSNLLQKQLHKPIYQDHTEKRNADTF